MAPFSGNLIAPRDQSFVRHDTATYSRSDNNTKYDLRSGTRSINSLGQRKTVGVIFDAYRSTELC